MYILRVSYILVCGMYYTSEDVRVCPYSMCMRSVCAHVSLICVSTPYAQVFALCMSIVKHVVVL